MCISFLSIVIALNTAFTQTLTLFEEYYVNDELLDCGANVELRASKFQPGKTPRWMKSKHGMYSFLLIHATILILHDTKMLLLW